MGKIKLNLVSGAVVEKPLINAFRANNNNYVVFDNEMNGSMGLPIILVCKLENNRLIKIIDQGEWQVVKEYLKNIIAGNQVEYIKVNNEISADDIYYTQLTLPVPSFDALKNAYNIEKANDANQEVVTNTEQPVIEPVPNVMQEAALNIPTPVAENVSPVVEPVVVSNSPVVDINIPGQSVENNVEVSPSTPVIDFNTPMPTFGSHVQNDIPVVEPVISETEITPTPVIESETVTNDIKENIFKEQKEAFMQACENMFDALVQKFEKELENHK